MWQIISSSMQCTGAGGQPSVMFTQNSWPKQLAPQSGGGQPESAGMQYGAVWHSGQSGGGGSMHSTIMSGQWNAPGPVPSGAWRNNAAAVAIRNAINFISGESSSAGWYTAAGCF